MNLNVLVVEDEKSVRTSISQFIRELGHPYHLIGNASNGSQALEFFQEEDIHILLTDIRMPQMDGLKLIEDVRGRSSQTKIVILSGYNDFEYAKRALQFGVVDYLLKPLQREELISTLTKISSSWACVSKEFSSLMVNEEKWDLPLMRIESRLMDHVELGDLDRVEEQARELLKEFRIRVEDDPVRLVPFIIDFLLSLRKRLFSIDMVSSYIDDQWDELISGVNLERSRSEIEEHIINFH